MRSMTGRKHLLEQLEVEQQAGLVERGAGQRDADLVVVAVRVLALAFVVAEIVAGGEICLHGDFIHRRLLDPVRGNRPALPHSNWIGCDLWLAWPRRLRRAARRASSLRRSTCSKRLLMTPTSAEARPAEQKQQRHRAPQRAVGRQAGLKARRHQRHAAGDEREEAERGGQNVEVAGHRRKRAVSRRGLLRF